MLFVDYQLLRSQPQSTIDRILKFLSLSTSGTPGKFVGMQQYLQTKHQGGIDTQATRAAHRGLEELPVQMLAQLQRLLLPHIRALAQVTGLQYTWNVSSINR